MLDLSLHMVIAIGGKSRKEAGMWIFYHVMTQMLKMFTICLCPVMPHWWESKWIMGIVAVGESKLRCSAVGELSFSFASVQWFKWLMAMLVTYSVMHFKTNFLNLLYVQWHFFINVLLIVSLLSVVWQFYKI